MFDKKFDEKMTGDEILIFTRNRSGNDTYTFFNNIEEAYHVYGMNDNITVYDNLKDYCEKFLGLDADKIDENSPEGKEIVNTFVKSGITDVNAKLYQFEREGFPTEMGYLKDLKKEDYFRSVLKNDNNYGTFWKAGKNETYSHFIGETSQFIQNLSGNFWNDSCNEISEKIGLSNFTKYLNEKKEFFSNFFEIENNIKVKPEYLTDVKIIDLNLKKFIDEKKHLIDTLPDLFIKKDEIEKIKEKSVKQTEKMYELIVDNYDPEKDYNISLQKIFANVEASEIANYFVLNNETKKIEHMYDDILFANYEGNKVLFLGDGLRKDIYIDYDNNKDLVYFDKMNNVEKLYLYQDVILRNHFSCQTDIIKVNNGYITFNEHIDNQIEKEFLTVTDVFSDYKSKLTQFIEKYSNDENYISKNELENDFKKEFENFIYNEEKKYNSQWTNTNIYEDIYKKETFETLVFDKLKIFEKIEENRNYKDINKHFPVIEYEGNTYFLKKQNEENLMNQINLLNKNNIKDFIKENTTQKNCESFIFNSKDEILNFANKISSIKEKGFKLKHEVLNDLKQLNNFEFKNYSNDNINELRKENESLKKQIEFLKTHNSIFESNIEKSLSNKPESALNIINYSLENNLNDKQIQHVISVAIDEAKKIRLSQTDENTNVNHKGKGKK